MPKFKLLSTTGDQTIELSSGRTLVVGRAATSDAPVFDPTVSRKHAELSVEDSGVTVRDLGSSNGTFVNGTRIVESVAQAGDVVTFGKVAFKVIEAAHPKAGFTTKPPPEATIVRQVAVKDSHAKIEEQAAQKLSLLLEISKELSKQLDVDKLLERVVDITFQIMNVDRVSILMVEGADKELVPRVSKNRTGEDRKSVV